MRTFFIPLVVFLTIFFTSCYTDKSKNIGIINPGKIIEKKTTLSHIADDITYIPLSNEILCSAILPVLTDSLILIKSSSEGLLTYDFNGRFKSRIGKKGRGPGEYYSGSIFTFDNINKTVYILDVKNKILKYSMQGDFLREIAIPDLGQKFFSEITFSNNKLYLFEGINQGFGKYDWIELDTLGNLLLEKFNEIEKFPSSHGFIGNIQESYDNTLYYWNQINDTIFKIIADKHKPVFLFSQGEFRFPKQKIRSISTEYFLPFKIFFTKDYLFFCYNYQFQNCTGIYFKAEQQLYAVSKTNDTEKFYLGPGIVNDIDGGLPLIPISYYQNNNKEEFLIGSIIPYQLKDHVNSKAFINFAPLSPEKKKELEKLANSLNENDNPVLMLVKLKE